MNVVIYQSLIIHIFILFYGVHTFSVTIKGSNVGLIGGNGTEIECSYTPGNYMQLSVSFSAYNKSSTIYESIATYILNQSPQFNTAGQYLNGRVTLTPITTLSKKAVMTFNKLMCVDGTFYYCNVFYQDSSGPSFLVSDNISISVQVPPSKPDSISLVHTPADSSMITTNIMDYSSSSPSTAVTSNENDTVSASHTDKQNTTTAFDNSTTQTNDHNSTTSTPSTISYRTTTYSLQQTTYSQGIAEGDNITAVCTGDVGNPPAEYFFEKYLNGKIVPMKDTVITTSIPNMPDNCSYYRTSNLTFQVTAKDNNTVIRCVVNSSMEELLMYVETAPIEVYSDTSTLPSSSPGSSSGTDEIYRNPPKDLTPVFVGVSIAVLLVVLGCYLFKRKRKGKDESAENNGSTNSLMHCNSKYVGESRPGAYDSVALEGDAPVISSGKKEQNAEDVRKHNEEYMKKQKNEEKIENKSPTSHQPVIYAAVNEATKSKYKQTIETQDSSYQQKDDTYAETQEGVYDQSGDRRHKVNENAEQFDTVGDIKKRNSTDGIESSIQSSQKGSYVNQAFNKGEKRQVATVPPISRSSGGSQGDEQTSELNAKRSQKGYENVKGTDNTHTSDAHTINQTSL